MAEQENPLQQEPESLVEAPESVSTALSPEGSAEAKGVQEEAVTEAPVQEEDNLQPPASLMLNPVSQRSVGFVPKKQAMLQDLDDAVFSRIRGEQADNYTSLAKEAFSVTNSPDMDVNTVKSIATSNGGPQALREKAKAEDERVQRESFSAFLQQRLADQNASNEEIASLLQQGSRIKGSDVALEENTVTSLLSSTTKDPELRAIYENSPSVVDMLQETYEEQVLLYNKMEELREKAGSDFDYGLDFIRGATTLNSWSKILEWGTDWEDKIVEMRHKFRTAKTTEEKLAALNESEEQISQSIILGFLGENPDYTEEVFQLAFGGSEFDRDLAAFFSNAEIGAAVLGAAGGAARGVGALTRSGGTAVKKKLGTATGEEVMEDAKNNPESVKDVLSMRMPEDDIPSQYNKVKQGLERQREALRRAEAGNVAPAMRTEAEQFPVFDQGNVRSQYYDGETEVVTEFVTAKGNPFASPASAKQRASRLGLEPNSYEVVEENGGFVIKYRTELDNFGAPLKQPRPITWFTAKLGNVDNFIDEALHQKGRLSEAAFARFATGVRDVWKNGIKPMKAGEKRDLDRVMTILRDKNTTEEGFNRWFTEDEFIQEFRTITKGQEPSERIIQGYHTYRQLSDFAWRMDNKVEYERLANNGYEGYSVPFTTETIAAKQADSVGDDVVVIDTVSGDEVPFGQLKKEKYEILEVDVRDRKDLIEAGVIPATPTKYFAVPKGKAKAKELDPVRIPYLAGGRVIHDKDTMFLKQATVLDTPQGRMRGSDRTLYRASTKTEADDYAKRWNQARRIAKDYQGADSIPKRVRDEFDALGLGTLDDFLQNAQARGWDLDTDMVAVANRQRIELDDASLMDEFAELESLPEVVGNRFSKRGQGVPHILGDAGDKPLDPLAALSESVNATGRNVAYSTYRQFSLETLKRKFGRYLDVPDNAPLRSYLDAPVNRRAQEEGMVNATKAHQKYVQDVVGMRTFDERMYDRYLDKAAAWAFGRDFGPISGRTAAKIIEGMKGRSPIDLARKVIFNAFMGMFNVGVMALQASLAPVVAATVPKYGMRALANYPLFRAMLIGSSPTDGGFAKWIGNKAKAIDENLDVRFIGDLDEAVEEFRNLGINNFDANLIYTDAAIGSNRISMMTGGVREKLSGVAAAGRKPFNESEMMPRIVSYMAARAEWLNNKTINPKGLPATSNAGRQWIYSRTDKYVLGMTRADVQLGLRGNVAGAVFQFQSYVWRATGAFFGKTFTKGEKARMGLAYVSLFGTGAVPIPFSETALDATVNTLSDDPETRLAFKQGVIDGIMSSWLGYETNFRSRASLGQYWEDLWDSLTGDKNFLELAGGAAGQTGHRAFDGLFNVMRTFSHMANPQMDDFTEEMAVAVASNISSVNNTYKAWVAWDTGMVLSRSGRPLVRMTHAELVGQVFGFPSAKYAVLDEAFNEREASKEVKDAYVEDILRLQRLWTETQDTKKQKEYEDTIRAISNSAFERGFGSEVVSNVFNTMRNETLYSRMTQEYMMNFMSGQDTTDKEVVQQIKEIQEADERGFEQQNEQEQ